SGCSRQRLGHPKRRTRNGAARSHSSRCRASLATTSTSKPARIDGRPGGFEMSSSYRLGPELVNSLKRLKLGPVADTLPDPLVLADKQDFRTNNCCCWY